MKRNRSDDTRVMPKDKPAKPTKDEKPVKPPKADKPSKAPVVEPDPVSDGEVTGEEFVLEDGTPRKIL